MQFNCTAWLLKTRSGKAEEPETAFSKNELTVRRSKLNALPATKIHELIEKHQVAFSKRLSKHDLVIAVSEEKAISTHEIGLAVVAYRKPRSATHSSQSSLSRPPDELGFLAHLKGEFANLDYVYLFPEIPKPKLDGAASYLIGGRFRSKHVLVLYDNTFWGGAGDGFCLTRDSICWHNIGEPTKRVMYSDVYQVQINPGWISYTVQVNGENIDLNLGDSKRIARSLENVLAWIRGHVD